MIDPYDAVPYTDHAYAETHPDRLAVVARLNRFEPPKLEGARVLEIGCGRGGNLLPMAAGMPTATFVGVDRSQRQIDEAVMIARATRLDNVRFVRADFEALGRDETFDFVIAHGLWSWISLDARRALFRVVHRALAPRGIAYVSFNALPGWYERFAARDWMRAFASPATARRSLEELSSLVSPELAAYKRSLERVAARLDETDEAYAAHEYFAGEHHPALVGDFLDEAQAAGLEYLGDAIPQETAFELAPAALAERAAKLGPRDAQQLLDFARNTAFRRALLVRADGCDEASWRWSCALDATALARMTATSRLRSTAVEGELTLGDVTVQVGDGARRAIAEMARVAPRAAPIEPSCEELFDMWLATNAIDLHLHAPALDDGSRERPRACPVARWHAANGGPLTNRWHQEVVLDDDVTREVLARLDGTRTIDDLARELPLARVAVAQLASVALLVT